MLCYEAVFLCAKFLLYTNRIPRVANFQYRDVILPDSHVDAIEKEFGNPATTVIIRKVTIMNIHPEYTDNIQISNTQVLLSEFWVNNNG